MKQISANIITWDPREDETYLNGSQISLSKGEVAFKNELMSPGKPLVTWYSQQNYQTNRNLAKLPLLTRGQTYQLKLVANVEPHQTLYLKVSFYSRFGEVLQTVFIKDAQGEFEYPKDAYEYRLELINAGAKKVNFKYLILAQAKLNLQSGYCVQTGSSLGSKIAIVFAEPDLRALITTEPKADTVVFSAYEPHAYFEPSVGEKIAELAAKAEQLAFVGNGALSNAAAAYYSNKYQQKLLMTPQLPTEEQLDQLLVKLSDLQATFEKATIYHRNMKIEDDFAEKLYENNVAQDDLRVR